MDGGNVSTHRLPKVWFYSRSVLYPRLIAEFLNELKFRKLIHHEWGVRVLSFASELDTRFSISPEQNDVSIEVLEALQQESTTIATHLNKDIRKKAMYYLSNL